MKKKKRKGTFLVGPWDHEEALEVAREEGREEIRKEVRRYFLELLNQGLSIDEIKVRLNQKEVFNGTGL